jgi:glycine cleavage system H lipoate-binding protein
MENKSNKREHLLILSSIKLQQVSYYVQMWHREVLTSLTLIGLSNTILQMIQKITFIELEEQLEELVVKEELYSSFLSMKLVS